MKHTKLKTPSNVINKPSENGGSHARDLWDFCLVSPHLIEHFVKIWLLHIIFGSILLNVDQFCCYF